MTRLIRDRTIVDDTYTLLRDATSLADVPDVPVIVPLALWQKRRAALIARGEAGVWLAAADHPDALADDVRWLPVIAIDVPRSADRRGRLHARLLHARLLRKRHGYAGELRAIGDIGQDDLKSLAQAGFDTIASPGEASVRCA